MEMSRRDPSHANLDIETEILRMLCYGCSDMVLDTCPFFHACWRASLSRTLPEGL